MSLKDRYRYFVLNILNSLVVSLCFNIIIAFVSQNIFEAAITGNVTYLKSVILTFSIPFLVGLVIEPISRYYYSKSVNTTVNGIRSKLYAKIGEMPFAEYETFHSGSLLTRVTNDIENVDVLLKVHISNLVFACIHGIVPLSIIFYYDYRMGLFVCLFGVLQVILNNLLTPHIKKNAEVMNEQITEINKIIIDIVDNFKITKIFNIEKTIFNIFQSKNKELFNSGFAKSRIMAIYNFFNTILDNSSILIILFGYFLYDKGYVSIGTVIAISLLQGNAIYLFSNIGSFIISIQASLASTGKLYEILNISSEDAGIMDSDLKISEVEQLMINNISFAYKNDTYVLKNISLSAKRGEYIGLIGLSGSGKSTLLKLILKFYPFEVGDIVINDMSYYDLNSRQVRSFISYVPQTPYLFHATILENIKYGSKEAKMSDVIAAAKNADIYDFIMSLPDKFDTIIEPSGHNFSGGQIQRICIARAFINNAQVIIFDEAMSALDSLSKNIIQKVIYSIKDKIIFIIDHDISVVQDADNIYVLENGEIVEAGNHAFLMENRRVYYNLYNKL